MSMNADQLYELLPAVHRIRDAENGEVLRALVEVLASEAELLEENIAQLYDDWFIETCSEWVVPYIGDLVGNRTLNAIVRSRRADVAKTIYYRRRKATVPMLEELARDVTGWTAHVVEFFQLLGWTQNLDHLRMWSTPDPRHLDPGAFDRVGTINLRNLDATDRVNGAFDGAAHTVDVRPPGAYDGWHNIRTIGFFLWRLGAFPLLSVAPRQAAAPNAHGWHLSPLGNPAPVFTNALQETDPRHVAEERHVAGPIRRIAFSRSTGDYYGTDRSLRLVVDGAEIPLERVRCMDLSDWQRPPGGMVGVDVVRGRVSFPAGEEPAAGVRVEADYTFGFPAPIGGGPYERRASLIDPPAGVNLFRIREDGITPDGEPPVTHTSLTSALSDWAADGSPSTIISILDSRTYRLPASITLPNERWLAIESANGERPLLIAEGGALQIGVLAPAEAGSTQRDAALQLSGVMLEGFLRVTGDLGGLRIVHSTLVPGRGLDESGNSLSSLPSIVVEPGVVGALINDQLQAEIDHGVVGPLRFPEHVESLRIDDSIVDGLGGAALCAEGAEPGPRVRIERSTFLGSVSVLAVDASEAIFAGRLHAVRTQEGCVRFSYVPPGSRSPRRFRCQPSHAAAEAADAARERDPDITDAELDTIRARVARRIKPDFTSVRYGDPAYAQLRRRVPVEITTGAEDGSEMGAYSLVKSPQREANLRIRLQEYLPLGLVPGIIYVT